MEAVICLTDTNADSIARPRNLYRFIETYPIDELPSPYIRILYEQETVEVPYIYYASIRHPLFYLTDIDTCFQ